MSADHPSHGPADPPGDPSVGPSGDPRPNDLNNFLDAIAKALDLPPEEVAAAFEKGAAEVDFIETDDGRRAIGVSIGGKSGVVAMGRGA